MTDRSPEILRKVNLIKQLYPHSALWTEKVDKLSDDEVDLAYLRLIFTNKI